MANRSAAKVFTDVFKACSEARDKNVGWEIYKKIADYDFHPCQLNCDQELIELGLAAMDIGKQYTGGTGIVYRDPKTMNYE